MSSKPYGYIPYSDMGDCLDWDDVEALPPTEKSPVVEAKLVIVDKYEPMFFTATWTPTATVNGTVLSNNAFKADKPHTPDFMKVWARNFIRSERKTLETMGVDVRRAYAEWGGDVRDL